MVHRRMVVASLLASAALAGPRAGADDPGPPIDVTGATLECGAAPQQGMVVNDAAAPSAELPAVPTLVPLPGPGSFRTAMPAAADVGDGSDGAFSATSSQTLAAGSYQFTTFHIASGVIVSAGGPVTIRVTGDVTIDGDLMDVAAALEATADPRAGSYSGVDTPITIVSGGDLSLGSGARVRTMLGAIELDAAGAISGAAGSRVDSDAPDKSVVVRARGREGVPGDVTLTGCQVNALSGDILVQAAASCTVTAGANLGGTSSDVAIQAYGGGLVLSNGAGVGVTSAPTGVRLEATGPVTITGGGTYLGATSGLIRCRSFESTLTVSEDAEVRVTSGDIDLGAAGKAEISGIAAVHATGGRVRLTSFEGDASLAPSDDVASIRTTTARIEIAAAGSVSFSGTGTVQTNSGELRVEAHDGDIVAGTGFWLSATSGRLEMIASHGITLGCPSIRWGELQLAAGDGGIALEGNGGSARFGALRAVATGPVTARGTILAADELVLVSRDGTVDATGLVAGTSSTLFTGTDSAPITLASFAGASGRILAAGATLQTGSADTVSGNISLVIHDGWTAPPTEGFVAPAKVEVRRNRRRPDRSTVTASGWIDVGTGTGLVNGNATLLLGDGRIPVRVKAGRRGSAQIRGDGVRFGLAAARGASSRTRFKLNATRDVTRFLAADGSGPVTLRLLAGATDAMGTVLLTKDAFRDGGARGSRAAPSICPARCDVVLGPDGRDRIVLEIALGSLGAAPAMAPDVSVRFGPGFVTRIAGDAFAPPQDGVFAASDPVPGVHRATLDYDRGTLTLEADAVELGDAADGSALTTVVAAALAGEETAVRIRLGGSARRFRY